MKKGILPFLFLTVFPVISAQVDFNKVNSAEQMAEVWANAAKLNKPVFIDIYADWCGPCKWMDREVFALESTGAYMNQEFINVKMDGESDFGGRFARQNGLSAYPSFFLFNSSQQLMNMIVGAKPWNEFQPALASTLEYYPVLEVLQKKYESELLQQDEYPKFTAALREMGKVEYGNLVAENYLQKYIKDDSRTLDDIKVLAYYTDPGTENWNNLVSDLSLLKKAMGDDMENFVDHAVTSSIEMAVETGDENHITGISELLPHLTAGTSMDPTELEARANVYYYHYSGLFDELIDYIDNNYSNRYTGDHGWLFNAASDAVFLDPRNTKMATKGLEWFAECVKLEETHDYYYHLALCQYFTDSPDKAAESLETSLEFTQDPEVIATTKNIIEQVKQEIGNE